MPDYKKMYFRLFNAITDAINQLENAQKRGEEAYIESNEESLVILPEQSSKKRNTSE